MKYIQELILHHNLKSISKLEEQRLHRNEGNPKKLTARQIADHVFMDLIALWIMHNIFDYAPVAEKYAARTLAGGTMFKKWKYANSDLHNSIHMIVADRTDLLKSSADRTLMKKIKLNVIELKRYLTKIKNGRISKSEVRMMLQKFETQLRIEESNYRSIRRIAQDWENNVTSSKRQVITRMLMFYNMNARMSEMHCILKELAKSHNFEDKNAKNPEKSPIRKAASAVAMAGAAATGAGYLGWKFGKSLF